MEAGEGTQTKIVGKKKTRETIVSLLSWWSVSSPIFTDNVTTRVLIFFCLISCHVNATTPLIRPSSLRVRRLARSSAQILLPLCIPTACKASEGTAICATLLHSAILALGECRRETRAVLTPEPLTFFSGGSLQLESLSLWRSWNLTLTSSMLSWSRSQKLARSWEEGWGYADASWKGQTEKCMTCDACSMRVFVRRNHKRPIKTVQKPSQANSAFITSESQL